MKLEHALLQEEAEVSRPAPDSGRTAGQFHRAVADCARNMPLVVLMNALADLTAESVSDLDVKIRTRHRRKNCEYHRELFEAIRAHDSDAAYTLMVHHVGDIQDRVGRIRKKPRRNDTCGQPAAKRARARRPAARPAR